MCSKVRWNSVSFVTLLILFLNENGFYITYFKNRSLFRPLIFALIVLMLLKERIVIRGKMKEVLRYIIFCILAATVSMIYTVVSGSQSFSDAFLKYLPYYCSTMGMLYFNSYEKKVDQLKYLVMLLAVVFSLVYILQMVLYPRILFVDALSYRNGIRIIVAGPFFSLASIIALDYFAATKIKKYLVFFVILLYNIIRINQSRSMLLAEILAVAIYIFITYIENKKKNISNIFRITIAIVIMLIAAIWIVSYARTLFVSSYAIGESSTVKRLEAYSYYYSLFKEHSILGIGMIRNQFYNGWATYGVMQKLYVDDIGIVGFIAQWGCLGICMLYVWLRAYTKICDKVNRPFNWSILALLGALLPFNTFFNMDWGIIYTVIILLIISSDNFYT